ncbi:MAG TPA: hypothetical protein VMT43_05000 [Acidimicrobiales bacterium]|nr:hypothetical protein [Acidimicrobiales bacterium]
MRWERLFDDLEAQWDAAEQEDLRAEVADRTRRETARLRLVDRLRGNQGRTVALDLPGAHVRGALTRVGADWVLLSPGQQAQVVVPLAAVVAVHGLTGRAAEPGSEGLVAARLGLGHVLRALARDRAHVSVESVDGSRRWGRVERVGADHLELATSEPGEASTASVYVAFAGIRAVHAAAYD